MGRLIRWLKRIGWVCAAASVFGLLVPATAFADVIPSRVSDPRARPITPKDIAADATALAVLPPEDAAYFAGRPERVRFVAGLPTDQWIGAAALIVGIPALVYIGGRAATIFGD